MALLLGALFVVVGSHLWWRPARGRLGSMGKRGPVPKTNDKRHETWAPRQNKVLPPGERIPAGLVLDRIERDTPNFATPLLWARGVLSDPQAATYTSGEVVLVEVAARSLYRWLTDGPDRKVAELNAFLALNDKLLVTKEARLRAHVEIAEAPDAGEDEVAAMRELRARL